MWSAQLSFGGNRKITNMDYYESAEDIIITRSRALLELARHGCEDIEEFLEDLGDKEEYDAQAVLIWLGY